ncbi:MAG: hypothetical protein AAF485_23835 [Chloroflexota bacterium]
MSALIRRPAMRFYETITKRRMLTRLDELNQSQWLTPTEIAKNQRKKLYQLLEYTAQYVPYYQRLFAKTGFEPESILTDFSALGQLPLLTKAIIRENFDDLITTDPDKRAQVSRVSTSGSTGQPLTFMIDHDFRDYFTADLHRHLSWGGWQLGQPHAYMGGASADSAASASLRSRLMSWVFNRFNLNAYTLSDEMMQDFLEQVQRRKPRLIYGYASTLYHFAQFVQQQKVQIKLDSLFSSAEVLYPYQRQLLEETFQAKVFDRYATRELGELASQCEHQTGLHISPECVYIEVLNESGVPTQPGEAGQIVVTNLNNYGMPFIRYQLSDQVAWHSGDDCPCGRKLPRLSMIAGRDNDMFKTRDGRLIWGGLGNPLWDDPHVHQFQMIQKDYDFVLVRLVSSENIAPKTETDVIKAIQNALGPQVTIKFEFPDTIPPESSGKYRYQICEITEETG